MSNIKPSVKVDTTTDLHLDLLADPTKIKPQKKTISLTNISESDDEADSHVVDNLNKQSPNSRKSSKSETSESSKSSRSSKSSKSKSSESVSSNKSNKNLFNNKPILLSQVPVKPTLPPAPAPASNFFASFFGGGVPAPTQTNTQSQQQTQGPNQNYSFPNNKPKDNYDLLNEEQRRLKRLQKFAELKYIKDTYKVILTKEFSYNSDYHEMCAEIEFHRSNISKKNSVEFFKSMVFGSVGMVDKLNKMFDPFGLKDTLDGFPEHLQMTTKDSEIYEELSEKYKSKFQEYSVEVRFILLIMGSAAGFIATKKASESIPFFNNMDEGMKKEMMRNLSVNIQNNIVPQTAEQKAKEEQAKILQFMMQQKRQEEEKNQRMQNVLKQNDSQQKIFEQIAQNTKTAINKQNFLVSSEIDSEESSVQASASN
jgi:ribosomal protein L17